MKKLILGAFFFLGLSWVNVFLVPKIALAQRKTADEVYVQPIPGLKAGLFGISAKTVIESLIDDNYQAYCAAPTQLIGPEVLGEYKRFLELYFDKLDEDDKPLETIVSDPSQITNPNITNDEREGKGESLVNYQYLNKTDSEAINWNIKTDGVNRQRSLFDQCIKQRATRKDVMTRCQGLKGILLKECALNIDLPDMPGLKIADIDINCNDLLEPEKLAEIDPVLLKGMSKTPDASAINNNTKPAYLMICFHQNEGVGMWFNDKKVDDKKFYTDTFWSRLWKNVIDKKDECSIRTIRIPVALTEQNPYLESYGLEVQDAAKKSFMSLTQQRAEEEVFNSARGDRKSLALGELASGFNSDKRINLKSNDDEVKKALAFIVNGTAPACGISDVRQEEALTIGSDSTLNEGGPEYKDSENDAYGTWTNGGILASLVTKLKTILKTGKRIKSDFEGRTVVVESFIFAPYSNSKEKVSLQEFFLPQRDYEKIRFMAQEYWSSHINFQNFLVSSATDKECQSFEDPETCKWKEFNPPKIETDEWGGSWYVYGETVCEEKEFCVTGKDLGQQYSTPISYIRGDMRPALSLYPMDSPAWKHANKTLGDPAKPEQKPNMNEFLKGSGKGENDGGSSGNRSGEELSCQEIKNLTVKLPTWNGLMKMTCEAAKNDPYDAQLLWGLMGLENKNMRAKLNAGASSMSCGEIVYNEFGVSQIVGVIVPQCSPFYKKKTTDPFIEEVRNNADIACDIETSLEYVLRKRKSEVGWITTMFEKYNGFSPTKEELYLLMAARNLGIPKQYYEDIFTQPVCQGNIPIDGYAADWAGCGGDTIDYCNCAITSDLLKLDCGNIK